MNAVLSLPRPSFLDQLIHMANVVTNVGKAMFIDRLRTSATYTAEPKYIGWGTGAGTAAITDTTLFTETDTRAAGTSSIVTTTVTNDTYQVTGTMTASTAARNITNAGLFDAVSAGNLFCKADFSTVALNQNDSIAFTFKVAVS